MKKERLFYLDFVRAIAVISIVVTHFNARFLYLDPPAPEKAVITTTVGNLYIGDWGVSLFFIISGAALMYVYGGKCELKTFYKKRFLSIYPMFWIAYAVVLCYILFLGRGGFGIGIPKNHFVFTVIGFDGLLLTNGIPTFYLLGEWFLGVIILIYILFPLLRKLLTEMPLLLFILTLAFYVGGLVFCSMASRPVVAATFVFVRLPEVVFGMFFIKYSCKVNWKSALLFFSVIILNVAINPDVSSNIQTTYIGIASFLVLVFLSDYLKRTMVERICSLLSKYSYSIFLVHHVIIDKIMGKFDLAHFTRLESYGLFVVTCCVIVGFAWVLYWFHGKLMHGLENVRKGKSNPDNMK